MILINRKSVKLKKPGFYSKCKGIFSGILFAFVEGLLHGIIIFGAVVLSLPQARGEKGRVLPLACFEMSIFILIILIGMFRHAFDKKITKLTFILVTLITTAIMIVSFVLVGVGHTHFTHAWKAFPIMFGNYDVVTMIINTTIFALGVSLFLERIVTKILIPNLTDRFTEKTPNYKIIDYIKRNPEISNLDLIKHLFRDKESMEHSLVDLVKDKLDVNTLKINWLWEIVNRELNIKYLY